MASTSLKEDETAAAASCAHELGDGAAERRERRLGDDCQQTRMRWFFDHRQAERVFRQLENAKRRRGFAEPRVAAPWYVVGT